MHIKSSTAFLRSGHSVHNINGDAAHGQRLWLFFSSSERSKYLHGEADYPRNSSGPWCWENLAIFGVHLEILKVNGLFSLRGSADKPFSLIESPPSSPTDSFQTLHRKGIHITISLLILRCSERRSGPGSSTQLSLLFKRLFSVNLTDRSKSGCEPF